MRTKTLLLSAAAMAAGLLSSVAQSNVYSANVVGYMNFNLTNGYNLIAAGQLGSDASGTNNNVTTVFGTNLPPNTTVLAWSATGATFNNATWVNAKGVFKWSGDTNDINAALQLGQGVFIQSPSAATLTIVGNVVQGTNLVALSPGLNLVSFEAPVAGGLQTTLGYAPTAGDTVLFWDPVSQSYAQNFNYVNSKGVLKWSPSEPQITAGQAIFLSTTNPKWTNSFIVQ